MALFGFGKDKKEGGSGQDSELVLAYLEDAQRVRAPFTLQGPHKADVPAVLQSVDDAEGTATFQTTGPLVAEKGNPIDLIFIQEGLRLGGSTRLLEARPGVVVLELPEVLEIKERRKQPRARLNPKEGATLTALTGLFEGVGITGAVDNISESGVRVRVDKGMSIKGEKRLPLGVGLVPVGQPFILVKVNKLPKCPAAMELEGKAVYLDFNVSGLTIGLVFTRPKADVGAAIRGMVSSRTSVAPTVLPPKTRRKAEAQPSGLLADEPLLAPAPPKPPEPKPPEPVAPKPPEPVLVEAPPPPEPKAPEPAERPEEEAPAPVKSDSLMRLKKRSRAVVALARTAASIELLRTFLQEEGYGRVLVTTFPEEIFEFLRQPNLGVLFLDGNMSIVEALEFVQKLRASFHEVPPVVLAAEDISTAVVLAARRNGVMQLVVRPYALDATFSTLLWEQLSLK